MKPQSFERKQDVADSDSDATSKETLEDLEKSVSSDSEAEQESDNSETPSPDGTDDERREPDDAGPM